MSIPEKILQAGCDAYASKFLIGDGSLGDGIEAAYLAIHHHDDWVRAGPPAWTGEGLPPVGAHVVVHDDGSLMYGQGESGEVLAHVDGTAVIRMSYGLGCFLPRCLRTLEQIAAEEREAEIETLRVLLSKVACDDYHAAVAVFEAGYRKQVES